MKQYRYIGESDELTTDGKIYESKDGESFIDDTGTICKFSSNWKKYFELVSEESKTPKHYNNENGSLYHFSEQQQLNSWEFDIIKRVVRCRNKGEWRSDLEKTKVLIDLYLKEYKP